MWNYLTYVCKNVGQMLKSKDKSITFVKTNVNIYASEIVNHC